MRLHEQYRPRSWNELAGLPKIKATIDRLRPRGLAGRAYWIAGPSGSGKTTIARLLADEITGGESTNITEIDGRQLTESMLADIAETLRFRPLFGKGYCWIVNEAHLLRPTIIGRLLVMIDDQIPPFGAYVFTTTDLAQEVLFDARLDSSALLSRCVRLDLPRSDCPMTECAARLKRVARAEGLDGAPIEAYYRLLRECANNMRAAYQRIEAGDMLAKP